MENKKQKTTLKEVRKRMKKLTLAEKKQIIKKEAKEKEKKEASKQKITQRVKVNVNVPSSYNQPPSGNFPNSFYNREHTTLLKSINEQLKQKNEPVPISQMFNIPEEKKNVINDDDTNIFFKNIEKERELLESRLKNIPPQFSEKVESPPIFLTKQVESIPIVNKPVDKSGLSLGEQIEKKEDDATIRERELMKAEDILIKDKQKQKEDDATIRERELMKAEDILIKDKQKQKELESKIRERAQMKAEDILMKDKRKQKELEAEMKRRRKLNEAENQKQRITEKAFLIVLDNVSVEEQKRLQEAYDTGFLKDKEIKALLKKLKYTPEQVKRIYSTDI